MILGWDEMRNIGMDLIITRGVLTISRERGKRVEIPFLPREYKPILKPVTLITTREVRIRARETLMVETSILHGTGRRGNMIGIAEGRPIGDAIIPDKAQHIRIREGRSGIRVMNTSDTEGIIRKGTIVGILRPGNPRVLPIDPLLIACATPDMVVEAAREIETEHPDMKQIIDDVRDEAIDTVTHRPKNRNELQNRVLE
jgi:hypothetical protein